MSILIKGMEMPTSCGFCVFEQETGDGCECYINGCLTEYQKRPDDCPLVEIPPHGDLIDRDVVLESAPEIHQDYVDSDGYCWDSEWGYTRYQIENAPTIIPADEPFGKSEQLNL